ncbi:protein tolB [Senna tora]|uniref:Protein tolB n=1 Tax=Senna tora TaxID=362788 RepID=A0A834WPG9_9FABA|nr:protein tolB [Senna tora]
MKAPNICSLCFLLVFFKFVSCANATATADDQDIDISSGTSIIYYPLGRLYFAFDIYSLPIHSPKPYHETKLTDGHNLNYNGHFPSPSSSSLLFSLLPNQTAINIQSDQPPLQLIYVTERNDGFSNIYFDAVYSDDARNPRRRSALESLGDRIQIPLLSDQSHQSRVSMKDKPTVAGDYLVYVSTHEDPGIPRASWTAVYSTHLKSGSTRRLTPSGVADLSPAVSPSGIFTAAASYGGRGWTGEVADLTTDIYVFLTRDGTQRVKVVEHGGWPSWVDDRTFYFHRKDDDDGWWSVYRATLPTEGPISTQTVTIERVTPPGINAFTPAASPGNKNFIAVATRRTDSDYRHIELFDLISNEFKEVTRLISPDTHHYNPFISPDSTRIGYHKCRGKPKRNESPPLILENIRTTIPDLTLFRFDGMFPAFSPSGDRILFVDLPGVFVVNSDGSNLRQISNSFAFSTAWNPVRPGIVYTAVGPKFASESTEVDIYSIDVDDVDEYTHKRLTLNGKNNAFPSPSPDGKWLVFRSGRTGHKNLYIMDAVDGERSGLHRLTEGPWTDTMCNWSPDGDWIAFASDRDDPGSGSFELYLIHPNGTGLRKLVQSGSAGRTNHPYFSPDGKSIVFTSDYGGISAEPISVPHQFQPYGDIHTIKLDGSDIQRLTHDPYENGTPAWSPRYIRPRNVKHPKPKSYCTFDDCHWLKNNTSAGSAATHMLLPKPQCAGSNLLDNKISAELPLENEVTETDLTPYVGMEFETEEHAYRFYNAYAGLTGFSIRREWMNKSKMDQNIILSRNFVCFKEGFKNISNCEAKRVRKDIRTGCSAQMTIGRQSNGKYAVTSFEKQHNHTLATPRSRHKLPSQRKVSAARANQIELAKDSGIRQKLIFEFLSRQVGGGENVGCTLKDVSNHLTSKRITEMEEGEAYTLLHYFQSKKSTNPSFFYEIQLDAEDQITNIFWADAKMIVDYVCFGDIVSFDTTYRTNKNSRPFAPFLGFNHHRQTVIFGAALLYDETSESFEWLFKTFLKAMCEKKPKTIFTNQNAFKMLSD